MFVGLADSHPRPRPRPHRCTASLAATPWRHLLPTPPQGEPSGSLTWALAVSPVVLLLGLVLWGRLSTIVNAARDRRLRVAVAALAFGAGGLTVAVGLGKGAWVGAVDPLRHLAGAAHAPPRHHVGMARSAGRCRAMLPPHRERPAPRVGAPARSSRGCPGSAPPSPSPRRCSSRSASARPGRSPCPWSATTGRSGSAPWVRRSTWVPSPPTSTAPGGPRMPRRRRSCSAINCLLSGVLVALMAAVSSGLRRVAACSSPRVR